jgi:hypothetical protein
MILAMTELNTSGTVSDLRQILVNHTTTTRLRFTGIEIGFVLVVHDDLKSLLLIPRP